MKYMTTLEDDAFDLAIVDPPYGIGMGGGKIGGNNKGISVDYKNFHGNDSKAPGKDYFMELQRVSKNQIIWGANHFIENCGVNSPCWIVWDKDNTGNFADCELALTSFKTAVRKFKWRWNGMLQQDMKKKEDRIHPTQKPIPLYEWLLINYAKKGMRILDTHLGSGSSAIAAHYFGVDFVGCELDVDYFNAAKERFSLSTQQTTLFD
jgi:site-specific DNA-methyltransferase (adenine-specific)